LLSATSPYTVRVCTYPPSDRSQIDDDGAWGPPKDVPKLLGGVGDDDMKEPT